MIETVKFNQFRISEHIQFFSDVISVCKQNAIDKTKSEAVYSKLVKANNNVEQSFKQTQKSVLTQVLIQLDDKRDDIFKCINKISDGYKHHYNSDFKKSAIKISECIDKYGDNIHKLKYSAETSVISNLTQELTRTLSKELTKINISDIVVELNNVNNEFNKVYLKRVDEQAQNNLESAGELVKIAIEAYRELVKNIDAHNVVSPSEKLKTIINKLNVLINTYNTAIASRSTNNNDESDNE